MSQTLQSLKIDYFSNLNKGLRDRATYQQKGKILTDSVSQKMQQKILVSEVTLPEEVGIKNLVVPKKTTQQMQTTQEDLLRKVQNQKITLLQKIKDLTKQQDDLKNKIKISSPRQQLAYHPNINQQDQQKFKQALQRSRRHKKSVQRKNKQLGQLYRQRSLQQIKQQQRLNQIRREQNRKHALQNLKKLEQKSVQRKKKLQESIKKIKQIKQHHYTYLKNQEKDEQKVIQQEKQYQRKIEQIKNGIKLDIQSIREHERNYERHLQQSQLRLQQKSFIRTTSNDRKFSHNNYFSVVTKAQIEQQKANRLEKLNQGYIFKQRICKFQEKLSTEFKPKVSNKSKFTPLKQSLSVQALTNVQQREKGIKYLQISKKLKDIQKQKQRRMTQASPTKKSPYKDYTKQLKYKAYETAQTKFNTMIKHKSSLSNYQAASKALQLASQIQAKSKLTSDQKLLNSVNNKISLLKALQ